MKRAAGVLLLCIFLVCACAQEYEVEEGNKAPSQPSFLSPVSGNFSKVVINCSGSSDPDGDEVYYEIEALVNGSWERIAENISGIYVWTPELDAEIDLKCRATDLLNYSSWFNPPGLIRVDSIPPRITVVIPQANAILPKRTESVRINLTTSEKSTCILANYNKNFESEDGIYHTLLLTNMKPGKYVLNYTCFDWLNNSKSVLHTFYIQAPQCGDGECDEGESCETCPQDCGPCWRGGGNAPSSGVSKVFKSRVMAEFNETIFRVEVELGKSCINPGVSLIKVFQLPKEIPEPKGMVYAYYKVEKVNFEKSKNASIYFKLEKSWLERNEIARVFLYRYNDSSKRWESYPAEKVNESNGYEIFRVELPWLSYFAILGVREEKKPLVCEEGEKRCFENELQICVNNSWKTLEICEYGCNLTLLACNPKPLEVKEVCEEGEKRCFNNILQVCKNNSWKTLEICEYGCDAEKLECKPKPLEIFGYLILLVFIGSSTLVAVWKRKRIKAYFLKRKLAKIKREISELEESGINVAQLKENAEKAEEFIAMQMLYLASLYLRECEEVIKELKKRKKAEEEEAEESSEYSSYMSE